tara:strand:- start:187 stop:399 length:213 start_codon:yes stop_codon:yes gene_type:complete
LIGYWIAPVKQETIRSNTDKERIGKRNLMSFIVRNAIKHTRSFRQGVPIIKEPFYAIRTSLNINLGIKYA